MCNPNNLYHPGGLWIVSVPSDVVGIGTGISAIADEASEVLNEFQKTFYRVTTLETRGNKTIRREWVWSVFDVVCLLGVGTICARAFISYARGTSPYEEIKLEIEDWFRFLRSETQKLMGSAGAMGSSWASGLTGPIGEGIGKFGEGLGQLGENIGKAIETLGFVIVKAIESLEDTADKILPDINIDISKWLRDTRMSAASFLQRVAKLFTMLGVDFRPHNIQEAMVALGSLQKQIHKLTNLSKANKLKFSSNIAQLFVMGARLTE